MAKRRFSIVVQLPAYARPRNEWRRRVHAAVLEELARRGVGYQDADRLELRLALALDGKPLSLHAIDERVKDVVDALGGRIAGPRSHRRIAPIVGDDQIARIVLERAARRGRVLGELAITRYRRRRAR
ncbi:MAG: hypothetical protein HYY42_05580 [Chloroflexi bacterium]|nr:hypothetical protein [Chloroflexota bacterium]MBI2983632.1 hypothetical protein [Chloroflexota bacterium]